MERSRLISCAGMIVIGILTTGLSRIYRAHKFLKYCDDLNESYFERHQELPHHEWFWFSRKAPHPVRLVFSWKPLTPEAWFSDADIERVKS